MNMVFMGSDEIACPSLRQLAARSDYHLVGIVSQPDRPQGRNKKPAPCALKDFAEGLGLSVYTPERIGSGEVVTQIQAWHPELIVVVAYGQYIPEKILSIPPRGAINLHPSLLPAYRGASPIQQAVAHGETETGVTILYVSKEMDAGDILLQEVTRIGEEELAVDLGKRLAESGARLLEKAIDQLRLGTAKAVPQDSAFATVVHKLTKEDGRINWQLSAREINNRIRGFQPWPICYLELGKATGRWLRVYRARVEGESGEPGRVLSVKGEGPLVGTGGGSLRLLEVQPEGKKRMSGSALVCGRYLTEGLMLG
ncbi:MAG: methionyl-tRNA formyltransferase [Kiritimatiellae bacterium]|nr:methionyl-tRNA formyltransferase [Kiritimatiellia bacterium]MDD4736031.1 methionyl-tRNA formyltransferase [Kiritimatiellia bacterium]